MSSNLLNSEAQPKKSLGIVAGNGSFPVSIINESKDKGYFVHAVCFTDETSKEVKTLSDSFEEIKLGQFGKLINSFKKNNINNVIFAGGVNRVKIFGGVKLDLKGMAVLAKAKSTKDDLILRAVAEALENEGLNVLPCTAFSSNILAVKGVMTKRSPSKKELDDIEAGKAALVDMSPHHIGQLCVVKDGVIVAVEAVEGSDKTILRGGLLAGAGNVVVKFAKKDQDLRFDAPTIGLKTLESLKTAKSSVLAIEADKTIILDKPDFLDKANAISLTVVGV